MEKRKYHKYYAIYDKDDNLISICETYEEIIWTLFKVDKNSSLYEGKKSYWNGKGFLDKFYVE